MSGSFRDSANCEPSDHGCRNGTRHPINMSSPPRNPEPAELNDYGKTIVDIVNKGGNRTEDETKALLEAIQGFGRLHAPEHLDQVNIDLIKRDDIAGLIQRLRSGSGAVIERACVALANYAVRGPNELERVIEENGIDELVDCFANATLRDYKYEAAVALDRISKASDAGEKAVALACSKL